MTLIASSVSKIIDSDGVIAVVHHVEQVHKCVKHGGSNCHTSSGINPIKWVACCPEHTTTHFDEVADGCHMVVAVVRVAVLHIDDDVVDVIVLVDASAGAGVGAFGEAVDDMVCDIVGCDRHVGCGVVGVFGSHVGSGEVLIILLLMSNFYFIPGHAEGLK